MVWQNKENNGCHISGVRRSETVEMAELGFNYGCIGVRYFQRTLISQAVTPTDGCLTVSFITVEEGIGWHALFHFWPKWNSQEFYLVAEGSERQSPCEMHLFIYFTVADWLFIVMLILEHKTTFWTRWNTFHKTSHFVPANWPKIDFCGTFAG